MNEKIINLVWNKKNTIKESQWNKKLHELNNVNFLQNRLQKQWGQEPPWAIVTKAM